MKWTYVLLVYNMNTALPSTEAIIVAIKMLDTMLCCYERAPVTQRPNKQTSAHAYIEASFAWLRLQFYI